MKKLIRFAGNVCMVSGMMGLLYIFYPFIKEEFAYRLKMEVAEVDSSFSIEIPAIRIKAPIVADVDPYNTSVYKEALKMGVAQSKTSVTPNEVGMTYLFAHSSDSPWNLGRYNTAFYRLGKLKLDDEITINFEGKAYSYRVFDKKEVWPSEVNYLNLQDDGLLILQTCTPIGTDLKRLLVFAKKVKID